MDDHGFWRDGGSLALDFIGTRGVRRGELLPDPAALCRWLEETGTGAPKRVTDAELDSALALRAAMQAVVDAALAQHRPAAAAVDAVNAAAVLARPPALGWAAGGFVTMPATAGVQAALAAVASDLVALLGGPDGARLRACEAEDCSGVFLDTSRGGRRRWCSSERCGNRARVAAHRRRSAS